MVTLIPPYLGENTQSNAEIKIFDVLQKVDMDCTVFHSLGVASHRSKVYGEIDYVILCKDGVKCPPLSRHEFLIDPNTYSSHYAAICLAR